jgi:phospholipase/carboxylesterase
MKLHYLIKQPTNLQEKNPLLLLLHGHGSNEEDLFSFASELPDEYIIVSLRAPYEMQYGSYAWYSIDYTADEKRFSNVEEARISRDLVINFLEELKLEYAIDEKKVTLIGFSQGCILSYAIGVSYPEKIQRIVAMGGYFNAEIAKENFKKNNFSNLQIFASHGTVDQVVSVDWARKAKPILDSLAIKNQYKEYNMGHGINHQNFFDFKNWLIETNI